MYCIGPVRGDCSHAVASEAGFLSRHARAWVGWRGDCRASKMDNMAADCRLSLARPHCPYTVFQSSAGGIWRRGSATRWVVCLLFDHGVGTVREVQILKD